MVSEFIQEVRKKITERDKRFQDGAYELVMESLHYYVQKHKLQPRQHVSAVQLLEGFREYTLMSFGPMAKFILRDWGIRSCGDVGQIVYNMVNAGLMAKTEEDSLDDFNSAFDFEAVFTEDYTPPADEG